MKRKRGEEESLAKKARPKEPDYHLTPQVKDDNGEFMWPASKEAMAKAREIILQCAKSNAKTLIVPDKDADGLTSGVILYRTLILLGAKAENLCFHLLHKGETVHSPTAGQAMAAQKPAFIFVLDQGSRHSSPLISEPHTALVIDHHFAGPGDKPEGAAFCNACTCPPVATSSLLTYELCVPLHDDVASTCGWLCAIGTYGDLGTTLKFEPPFPDLSQTIKSCTKKALTDAVSMLNAPRRTARFDVKSALDALLASEGPKQVLTYPRLVEARREINEEVERCTHTPPKFSKDGRLAVFRISSEAQVHPLIATRWASHLSSKLLEIVLVANSGFLPDKVNFSCRIARVARQRDPPVDIIAFLKATADLHPSGTLRERIGEDFARGHVQASGGIVGAAEFEELMEALEVGIKPEKKDGEEKSPKKVAAMPKQSNTLMSYFGKSGGAAKS